MPEPTTPAIETKPDDGRSDFAMTGPTWGLQITSAVQLSTFGVDPITGMPSLVPLSVPMIGARKWASEHHGFELGTLFRIEKNTSLDANIFLGGAAGYMKTLSTHRHMRTFGEPLGGIGLLMQGEDGLDHSLVLFARLAVGTEIRLSMIGLEHIGLTARVGAGLQVASVGDNTTISRAPTTASRRSPSSSNSPRASPVPITSSSAPRSTSRPRRSVPAGTGAGPSRRPRLRSRSSRAPKARATSRRCSRGSRSASSPNSSVT